MLGHMVTPSLTLGGAARPLSRIDTLFYLPASSVGGLQYLQIFANSLFPVFLHIAILNGMKWYCKRFCLFPWWFRLLNIFPWDLPFLKFFLQLKKCMTSWLQKWHKELEDVASDWLGKVLLDTERTGSIVSAVGPGKTQRTVKGGGSENPWMYFIPGIKEDVLVWNLPWLNILIYAQYVEGLFNIWKQHRLRNQTKSNLYSLILSLVNCTASYIIFMRLRFLICNMEKQINTYFAGLLWKLN